jgi:hypothetical protein
MAQLGAAMGFLRLSEHFPGCPNKCLPSVAGAICSLKENDVCSRTAGAPAFVLNRHASRLGRMVKGRPKAERETKRSGVSERTLDDPGTHGDHNG